MVVLVLVFSVLFKKDSKKNIQILFIFLGFHEAIGDTMALAVNTPAHLEGLGLLPDTSSSGSKDEEKENIAYLFHVALQKVSFLLVHNKYLCNITYYFEKSSTFCFYSLSFFHLHTPW